MHDFDRPLFKRLPRNDSGEAKGNQSGFLVPKEMDKYFPQLSTAVTAANPTVDSKIRAALFVGSKQVDLVETRYQYQTRGATRTPERRITLNLGPMLDQSK